MPTDTKKINTNELIAKIESLQEIINRQTNISVIDIDLQLDNIRLLYSSYISMREDLIAQGEKNKKKSNLSECGTLPLFEDFDEGMQEKVLSKDVNLSVKEEFEQSKLIEVPAEVKTDENEQEETVLPLSANNPEVEMQEELQNEEVVADITSKSENDELTEDVNKIEEEIIENEFPIPDMDIEINHSYINLPIEQITFSPIEETETTLQQEHFKSEIDIDSIEFEENEDIEDDNMEERENLSSSPLHMGIPSGRPAYWGDEVDIEQPIIAKPTSIGDKYKNDKPSLNEIVSGFKPNESIGMKLQNESISDLMKSIDMNRKFLFVKELFKGNGSTFTEEINNINNYSKLDGALKYLGEIKEKYHWNDKSEAYNELYQLVLRKYAK